MGLCFAIPLVVSVLLCAGCAKENQFPVQKPKLSLQFIHNMLFLLIRFFLVSFLVLYGDNLSILITYFFFFSSKIGNSSYAVHNNDFPW